MEERIVEIRNTFEKELQGITDTKQVEALKVKYLGKKGIVAEQMNFLREVAGSDRPRFGKQVNDLKVWIEERLNNAFQRLHAQEESAHLQQETIDTTLPGRRRYVGSYHPVTQVMREIIDIFVALGFSVERGPEIETDYYNFEVLNFPPDHPARDMQDTFYVAPNVLLRTHTSNVQGRILERVQVPVRIISPGKVYRNESISARSHVFFHQVDGLCVDEKASFKDLLSLLSEFVRRLFHQDVAVRFRPSFFPFVEPGTELDISCFLCEGNGCPICKHTGWLEILGAGMVHPQVLRNVGLCPDTYTGYAWGLGVERIVLLRYGIDDIRLFAENDMRFLSQFPSI